MVKVEPVSSKRDLTAFIDHPYVKYAGDPGWVAPLRLSQIELFDEKKYPFWEHARRKLFLARQGGKVVGRIACIDDDVHNQTHDENLVFFGFFEAANLEVAQALYAAVEQEAAGIGRGAVRGPANPTLNDGAGFQLDAFDEPPYVMMPQSPPTYPAWAEAAGYQKVKDLYTFYLDARKPIPERIARIADRARARYQPVIRPANLKRLNEELMVLKRIHEAAWEKNWGNVPFTDAEIEHLANELKLIIDPQLALFLEHKGEPVAVCIAVPNANQVFAKFNGRLLPTGVFHLLRRKRIITQARLVMLGVLPEYRNRGFDLLLIQEVIRRALANGIVGGECGWTLEDNHAINRAIEAAGGVRNKTYRIYQKQL